MAADLLKPLAPGEVRRSALISPSGCYRYRLGRRWGDTATSPTATFVMLNPSTADGSTDDATIRRCVGYARDWGCAALAVVNLFAWRATDPRELFRAADPIGPQNDAYLRMAAIVSGAEGGPLVAAWGAHAPAARVTAVLRLEGMGRLTALALTRSGQPRHPLYLPKGLTPKPWEVP